MGMDALEKYLQTKTVVTPLYNTPWLWSHPILWTIEQHTEKKTRNMSYIITEDIKGKKGGLAVVMLCTFLPAWIDHVVLCSRMDLCKTIKTCFGLLSVVPTGGVWIWSVQKNVSVFLFTDRFLFLWTFLMEMFAISFPKYDRDALANSFLKGISRWRPLVVYISLCLWSRTLLSALLSSWIQYIWLFSWQQLRPCLVPPQKFTTYPIECLDTYIEY
jgi:hypothetical protein